jgi:signal transduction histidine kinase
VKAQSLRFWLLGSHAVVVGLTIALLLLAPRPMVGAIVASVLTAGIAISAAYVGTRSLKRLAAASHQLSEGSFDVQGDLDRAARSRVREVGELGEAMSAMRERLEARLHYITEFASAVSHEFKTPLSTLRGTVELLGDDPAMPAEQRARFLDNALTDLRRMDRLVHGLLELARAEETPAVEEVDLQVLLERVADEEGVELEGAAGPVRGNPTQIEAVARNLIDNARRHGAASRIVVRVNRDGFEVEDDGKGISEANQAQVFDRFFTTDRAGGGTGLGLSLVRTIVRSHGGDVAVESRPGRTVFHVRLPFFA